jgi:hypothetical protein
LKVQGMASFGLAKAVRPWPNSVNPVTVLCLASRALLLQ